MSLQTRSAATGKPVDHVAVFTCGAAMSSGLELDTSRRHSKKTPGAVLDPGRDIPLRPSSRRMRPEQPEQPEPDEVDPATHGAAMMIALGYLMLALVVIVRERAGTYTIYWVTGYIARAVGVIGLIFLGGWFQFLLGAIAQMLYQLVNIRWWVVGVAYAVVSVIALVRG